MCFCSGESLSRPNGAASKYFHQFCGDIPRKFPYRIDGIVVDSVEKVPGELLYRIDEIVVDSVGKFPGAFSI